MEPKRGYCLKCKKKQAVKNPQLHKMRNNRVRFSANCGVCDTRVSGIVGKKDMEGGNILFDIADAAPDALPLIGLIQGLLK